MQKRDLYLAILAFGFVFAFLALVMRDSQAEALTLAYLTVFTVLLLRLADEYLYFRSSRAAYATGLFVFIPAGLGIGSSLVAADSPWLAENLMYGHIDITIIRPGEYTFFVNSFALVFAMPFYAIAAYLILQYSQRHYRAAFLARRRLPGRFAGFTYSLALIGATMASWSVFSIIEITSAIFVTALICCLLYYYIWETMARAFQSASYPAQGRSAAASRSRATQTPRRQQRIGASSSNSWTSRPSFSARPAATPTTTPRQPTTPAARISPGIEASSRSRSPTRTRPAAPRTAPAAPARTQSVRSPSSQPQQHGKWAKLLPTGRAISEDDFRCIFCYEFPGREATVVLCPYCKRPAHLGEFQKWKSTSHLCSRCNKDLRLRKPIQIRGNEYQTLLRAFRKHMQ
ncbi:MAG: hypothetical protein ACFFGZ_04145 [Candidatus Thorarchaeota archaeon]